MVPDLQNNNSANGNGSANGNEDTNGTTSSGTISSSKASAPWQRSLSQEATTVFDFFLDIPHPAASSKNERTRIIEPPGKINPGLMEIYETSNITRIAMFAFPDYDADNDVGKSVSQSIYILFL